MARQLPRNKISSVVDQMQNKDELVEKQDEQLAYEILNLISLKQEGEYWDFKREWYGEKKSDLLHDIICMANNLADRDAYIIIGVDEENDFKPYSYDKKDRRNTQQLVDFLRDKKFAGDCRPVVTVKNLQIYEYDLDVIIIHNSSNTPFYLSVKSDGVFPNNIYIRTQDSNTPIDKSADISNVEKLWKKRFGIDKTALERAKLFLNHASDWAECEYDESKMYYSFAPEFTIEYLRPEDDLRTGREYYFMNQTDNTPRWIDIYLRYHQTVIYEVTGLLLDGGRLTCPAPDRNGFSLKPYHSWDVSYAYMEKDSLKYSIHMFYYDEENGEHRISRNALLARMLLFENAEEHQNFLEYAKGKWKYRDEYLKQIREPYIEMEDGNYKDILLKQTEDAIILILMLEEFRKIQDSTTEG